MTWGERYETNPSNKFFLVDISNQNSPIINELAGTQGRTGSYISIHELRGGSGWGIHPLENFWLINDTLPNKRENALNHGQETINKVERCRRLRRFQQTLLEEDPTNRSEDMSNESL